MTSYTASYYSIAPDKPLIKMRSQKPRLTSIMKVGIMGGRLDRKHPSLLKKILEQRSIKSPSSIQTEKLNSANDIAVHLVEQGLPYTESKQKGQLRFLSFNFDNPISEKNLAKALVWMKQNGVEWIVTLDEKTGALLRKVEPNVIVVDLHSCTADFPSCKVWRFLEPTKLSFDEKLLNQFSE